MSLTLCLLGGALIPAALAQHDVDCEATFLTNEGGLRAYWTFDDPGAPAADDFGGHHGINHGAAWSAGGVVGGALRFDGLDDYVEVPHDPAFNYTTWENYTITAWFLNDGGGDHGQGYGQKILAKNTWGEDLWISVGSTVYSSGELQVVTCHDADSIDDCDGFADYTHNFACGEWHHAVLVKSGAHGELWVDGVLKAGTEGMQSADNLQPTYFGFSPHPDHFQQKHWSGLLDEMAIFDRALTAAEVQEIFAASAGGHSYCRFPVALDLLPFICPNCFSEDLLHILPAAICGTSALDVRDLDASSLALVLPEGNVRPLFSTVLNVTTPLLDPEWCECHIAGPDCHDDLILFFSVPDIIAVFGPAQPDDLIRISVIGNLLDQTPIKGYDCLLICEPIATQEESWSSIKVMFR